jgi:hypothetical protein
LSRRLSEKKLADGHSPASRRYWGSASTIPRLGDTDRGGEVIGKKVGLGLILSKSASEPKASSSAYRRARRGKEVPSVSESRALR